MANEDENVVPASVATSPAPREVRAWSTRGPAGGGEPSLRETGRMLARGRWTIAAVTLVALAGAAVYLFAARPVYRATALMQVEEPPTIGAALEKLSPLLEQKTSIEGYVEIMRSRMVLGPVIEELGLDVVAEPRFFPLVGAAIARRHRGPPAPPPLGLRRYAWGGEQLTVSRLRVPAELVNEPLTLIALQGGGWRLRDPQGRLLLEGRTGTAAAGDDGGSPVELLVTNLVARPGTEFRLEKLRRDDVVDALQMRIRIDEKVKKSGVIVLELDGPERELLAPILSSLAQGFLRENMERRSEEAAKTLAFLDSQLPALKARMDAAEDALIRYRTQRRTVDLPIEAKTTVERLAELDKNIADLEAERAQLSRRYTPTHPDLVALERKLQAVRDERAALDPRVRAMPDTEMGAARLTRNATVATDLYVLLSNQAQMLRVAKAGTIGTVRLIDPPVVTRRPVSPNAAPALALALVLGLGLGATLVVTRSMFDDAAGDPQEIEVATGLPIFATVPHSVREAHLDRARRAPREPLALAAPEDPATEHLRALRTALAFTLKARGNVVAISSPSPGAGKTFVSANLAQLLAASGKRVLVVDADLRRGGLHRLFAAEQQPGLSELLAGTVPPERVVQATGIPNLELVARGEACSKPGELLTSPRLAELLQDASKRYDVVIVDTPPVLPVADALLVERCADVNLLVVRARQHRVAEVALAVERLARSGIAVHGGILNDARPPAGYARMYERLAADGGA